MFLFTIPKETNMNLTASSKMFLKDAGLEAKFNPRQDESEDSEFQIFKAGKDTGVRIQVCLEEDYGDKSFSVLHLSNVGKDKFSMKFIGEFEIIDRATKAAVNYIKEN